MDDTPPPRLAILGAGPIGLEATLYARYLGYSVDLYERSSVAEHVRRWGHVSMFSPFAMNCSSLGLAALEAQHENYAPPAAAELLTGAEWVERYLGPLAASDLVADSLKEECCVIGVGREGRLKGDLVGKPERGESSFRLLVQQAQGGERIARADVVLDCTGTFGNANWLGGGGLPAVGERIYGESICYTLPDVLGADREQYAARHTLLVGAGYSAATTAVALAELARQAPGTRLTWVTRRPLANGGGPILRIENDRLPERDRLAAQAAELAGADSTHVTHWPATQVEAISRDAESGPFEVEFSGQHAGRAQFDNVVANVGYRPDNELYEELQVHQCYATAGPMKLAAALLGQPSADCLDAPATGIETLLNPEPNFFIVGSKSYGRGSNFLYQTGLNQIRSVFALLHGRADLNLYRDVEPILA